MKFIPTLIISLAALFSVASANVYKETVRYDTFFDYPDTSLNSVACSNGDHGLVTKYPKFGSLPSYPNIGRAFAVGGWNSPKCGSCWKLTYKDKSIYITVIDSLYAGFEISLEAMNTLTYNKAKELDSIDVDAEEVDEYYCGLW